MAPSQPMYGEQWSQCLARMYVWRTVWNDDTVKFIRLFNSALWNGHNHVNYLGEESSVWDENAFIMTQKMARLLSKPSLSCDVSTWGPDRDQAQHCAHVKTEREAHLFLLLLKWIYVWCCEKTKSEFSSWAVCTLQERFAAAGNANVTERLNDLFCCLLSLFLANCWGVFCVSVVVFLTNIIST